MSQYIGTYVRINFTYGKVLQFDADAGVYLVSVCQKDGNRIIEYYTPRDFELLAVELPMHNGYPVFPGCVVELKGLWTGSSHYSLVTEHADGTLLCGELPFEDYATNDYSCSIAAIYGFNPTGSDFVVSPEGRPIIWKEPPRMTHEELEAIVGHPFIYCED